MRFRGWAHKVASIAQLIPWVFAIVAFSLAGCGGGGGGSDGSAATPTQTAPTITSQPQNATVTAGQTATFSVTASGTEPLSYQWRRNGTAIAGATSSSYTTAATIASDSGAQFNVMVSNGAGSATSNTAVLTVTTGHVFGAAVGLFVLDSPLGTYRDGNLRDFDFVAGYAWRYGWTLMEPTEGQYDFSALDHILARVAQKGQKLSWIVMPTLNVGAEPAHVLARAATWVDKEGVTHAQPWDSFVLARYKAFFDALAAHRVADPTQGGARVPLGDHSAFYALNITFPGVPNLALRDKRDNIVDIPGYTRAGFEGAVISSLRAARTAFPKQFIHFGFWKYQTDAGGGEAWQSMHERVLAEFGGTIGLFQDNLAASRPCSGCNPVTGSPTAVYAAPLSVAKGKTYTAYQALTAWANPTPLFGGQAKVLNGTPMDGIAYGLETFDARYVELYVEDVDRVDWHAGLRSAAAALAK